jgi:hypothetical protein
MDRAGVIAGALGVARRIIGEPGMRDIGPFDIRLVGVANIYSATSK